MTTVRNLADEVWAYRLEREPFLRLRRGLPVTRLPSETLAQRERDGAYARSVLTRLDQLDSSDDPATAGFMRWLLTTWLERVRFHWLPFSVTPYASFGLSVYLQRVFTPFSFDSAPDAQRYVSLVADYRDVILEIGNKLATQRAMGILLPQPAVPGARDSLARHRDAAARTLTTSAERARPFGSEIPQQVQRMVDDEIVPAFHQLLAMLDDEYMSAAPEAVGCQQYPDGSAYYEAMVREHTTSDRTAEEIHRIGLDQVAMLTENMAKARADLGFAGSEAEFHAGLAADARFFATEAGQVEATYLRHMAALEAHVGEAFRVLPQAKYGVARLPQELEAGMTYGYYQPPTSADPIGKYMFNGSALDQRSMLTAASLIFHELAPGHHFHLARQGENTTLPDLRREAVDLGGFNEGWAEYAAGLGWDLGLYEDPYDGYGRLVHERFTAQRLVVDTGMASLGWSLEQARGYMRANTTESDTQIVSETLRYSTDLPGQALAYRLGFLEFNALRDESDEPLADFNERILGAGALPFPVIRHTCADSIVTNQPK